MSIDKHPMVGKIAKFAIGDKQKLMNLNKILQKVELYIDGESGILYVIPEEDN